MSLWLPESNAALLLLLLTARHSRLDMIKSIDILVISTVVFFMRFAKEKGGITTNIYNVPYSRDESKQPMYVVHTRISPVGYAIVQPCQDSGSLYHRIGASTNSCNGLPSIRKYGLILLLPLLLLLPREHQSAHNYSVCDTGRVILRSASVILCNLSQAYGRDQIKPRYHDWYGKVKVDIMHHHIMEG